MTLDFKQSGDLLYLLGETKDELGASEYFSMLGYIGANVPTVDAKKNAKHVRRSFHSDRGRPRCVRARRRARRACDRTRANRAVAGQLGADLDLANIPGGVRSAESILFSESQGRVLVSIRPDAQKEFEKIMRGVPHARIGQVGNAGHVSIELPRSGFNIPLSKLTAAYRKPFKNWL